MLDVDATIVVAHSEKENAAATFKRTFGYHPIGVWCDNTQEFLAAKLRAGNAGSNTTADHIEVLTDAITQVPGGHRKKLLIRCDGAGASHALLDWLTHQGRVRGRSVEYSVGFPLTDKLRDAIDLVPKKVWTPAIDADGGVREGGDVAELTGLIDPAVQVAAGDARHRASRTPPPRCATVAVRGTLRLALPSLRHQHHPRPTGVP